MWHSFLPQAENNLRWAKPLAPALEWASRESGAAWAVGIQGTTDPTNHSKETAFLKSQEKSPLQRSSRQQEYQATEISVYGPIQVYG